MITACTVRLPEAAFFPDPRTRWRVGYRRARLMDALCYGRGGSRRQAIVERAMDRFVTAVASIALTSTHPLYPIPPRLERLRHLYKKLRNDTCQSRWDVPRHARYIADLILMK